MSSLKIAKILFLASLIRRRHTESHSFRKEKAGNNDI